MARASLLACALWLTACASASGLVGSTSGISLPSPPSDGALPEGVRPELYRLRLDVDPTRGRLWAEVEIDIRLRESTDAFWLHAKGLEVSRASVQVDGQAREAWLTQVDDSGLAVVQTRQALPAGVVTLHVAYEAPLTDSFAVVADGAGLYAFLRSGPGTARSVFPCFDAPGFAAPIALTVRAPDGSVVVSRAAVAARSGRRVRFEPTPSIVPAALAFAVGPFDVIEGPPSEAAPIALRGIAARGRGRQLAEVLGGVAPLVEAMEASLGVPLPHAAVDVLALPDGAPTPASRPGLAELPAGLLPRAREAAWVARARREALAVALAGQWLGAVPSGPADAALHGALARWLGAHALTSLHGAGAAPSVDATLASLERFVGAPAFAVAARAYVDGGRRAFVAALEAASSVSLGDVVRAIGDPLPTVDVRLSCEEEGPALVLSRRDGSEPVLVCARHDGGEAPACARVDGEQVRLALPSAQCPAWVHPDAGGLEAYRFTLDVDAFEALGAVGAPLTPAERHAVVVAAVAAQREGRLPLPVLYRVLTAASEVEQQATMTATMATLAWLVEHVASEEARPAARRAVSGLYARQLRRLGYAQGSRESDDTTAQRREVLAFVALIGQDASVRARLARDARALLDRDGLDRSAVDASRRGITLIVGAQEGGAAFFDAALQALYATEEPALRAELVQALGAATEPALVSRARALTLDAHLSAGEALRLLRSQGAAPATRAGLFDFVGTHADALLARLGPTGAAALVAVGVGSCTEEDAEALGRAMTPGLEGVPGGREALDAALVSVRACAASAARDRSAAEELFDRAR